MDEGGWCQVPNRLAGGSVQNGGKPTTTFFVPQGVTWTGPTVVFFLFFGHIFTMLQPSQGFKMLDVITDRTSFK